MEEQKKNDIQHEGDVVDWAVIERGVVLEVRRLRAELGINQTEFARLSGVSQQEISRVEKGKQSPGLRTICKMVSCTGYELVLRKKGEVL